MEKSSISKGKEFDLDDDKDGGEDEELSEEEERDGSLQSGIVDQVTCS